MATVLNSFKTITANLTTSTTTVYTTPSGYATVILLAQISNISGATVTVSGYHNRSGIPTALVQNSGIPVNDAINVLTGRMIMQYGDTLSMSASANSSAQLILSILETAQSS